MSKRHQSSRRKSYGRRQHEIHERTHRRHVRDGLEFELDPFAPDQGSGEHTFFDIDIRGPRLRFVLGD